MNIFRKLFSSRQGTSPKNLAKERLQLVLIQDRLDVNTSDFASLKSDLVDVIARYIEIDKEAMEVSLERDGAHVALMANIPLRCSRVKV